MRSSLPELLPPKNVARLLGIPEAWLIEEATAGRLPHLQAGDKLLFSLDAIEAALVQRAKQLKAEGGPQ